MNDNRQLLVEHPHEVLLSTEPPVRTDDGTEAVPFIQVTEKYAEPPGPRMSRQEMYEYLLAQHGQKCQGCDRTFDDPRYLELDHNTPRSDGGLNHITNRVLLCSPCNRAKSNLYTLSGLRRINRKKGWMAKP
jgi:5-methylcytosine-specific restriction endonuclease McrA